MRKLGTGYALSVDSDIPRPSPGVVEGMDELLFNVCTKPTDGTGAWKAQSAYRTRCDDTPRYASSTGCHLLHVVSCPRVGNTHYSPMPHRPFLLPPVLTFCVRILRLRALLLLRYLQHCLLPFV